MWPTVRHAPHTLEFEMILANHTLCTLHQYCGPILGPMQMLVGKDQQPLALVQLTGEKWGLVIGPGVDPCLVVCFVAIVNSTGR
jgi:hypothetical protein